MAGIGAWTLWLLWLAVFSRHESCGIELAPFADIRQSIRGAAAGLDLQTRLVFANIAAFAPLGYLIGLGGLGRLRPAVLVGLTVSVTIELVQHLTCRGATTTDDLFLNVAAPPSATECGRRPVDRRHPCSTMPAAVPAGPAETPAQASGFGASWPSWERVRGTGVTSRTMKAAAS